VEVAADRPVEFHASRQRLGAPTVVKHRQRLGAASIHAHLEHGRVMIVGAGRQTTGVEQRVAAGLQVAIRHTQTHRHVGYIRDELNQHQYQRQIGDLAVSAAKLLAPSSTFYSHQNKNVLRLPFKQH